MRPVRPSPALVFLLLALLVTPSSGQDTTGGVAKDSAALAEALTVAETWLEAQRAYERIPGLSAALVHGDETVWSGAFGLAHPDRAAAASTGTLYSICSISKLFTSIAVMQLRDRGLLDLSDPLAEHLPWYAVRQTHEDAAPVTVEGVLTHSAGLPRESAHPYWSAPAFEFPTREEIIEGLSGQETLYPAWRYFQYSNLGLTLAGEVVRELSGQPYDEYVRRNILDPLGLRSTYPEMPEAERGRRLATGYGAMTREGRREELPFFQARGIAPAAGYASTVEDLARFAAWQFGLDEGEEASVLSPHTLREMQRVHYVDPGWNTFWGLGFSIRRHDDRTLVGHGGSCPGYRSDLLLDMQDHIGAVFMANASGVNASKFTRGLFDLVGPALRAMADEDDEGDGPSEADEESDEAGEGPDLDDYVGTYSVQPWGGETAVVRWKGVLALLPLPTDNPADALTRLRRVEEDTFRRVRSDDELGEAITFERDASGRVVRMRRFENLYPRVR